MARGSAIDFYDLAARAYLLVLLVELVEVVLLLLGFRDEQQHDVLLARHGRGLCAVSARARVLRRLDVADVRLRCCELVRLPPVEERLLRLELLGPQRDHAGLLVIGRKRDELLLAELDARDEGLAVDLHWGRSDEAGGRESAVPVSFCLAIV